MTGDALEPYTVVPPHVPVEWSRGFVEARRAEVEAALLPAVARRDELVGTALTDVAIVDSNPAETTYATRLGATHGLPVARATLRTGDVELWSATHRTLLVIERKTQNDLLTSLQSGHWLAQRARLLALNHVRGVRAVLLVEWDTALGLPPSNAQLGHLRERGPQAEFKPVSAAQLFAHLDATCLRDRLTVLHARSAEDSCARLAALFRSNAEGAYAKPSYVDAEAAPVRLAAKPKCSNPRRADRLKMLMALSGLSEKRAGALLDAYPTFVALTRASLEELRSVKLSGRALPKEAVRRLHDALHTA